MLKGWRRYWRRHLRFMPWQPCYICGHIFWAGLPWLVHPRYWGEKYLWDNPSMYLWENWPGWQDYCSKQCCDDELEILYLAYRVSK